MRLKKYRGKEHGFLELFTAKIFFFCVIQENHVNLQFNCTLLQHCFFHDDHC